MLSSYHLSCGKIDKFFDQKEMTNFVQVFKKLNFVDGSGNACYGIDQKHLAYSWFKKIILDRVAQEINPDLKLIFAMLLDCVIPFPIHKDIKLIPDPKGKHYVSFLLPYSVNDDVLLTKCASTLFFNTRTKDSTVSDVSYLHSDQLSHIPLEETYKYNLQQEIIWNIGDLLWWDSKLPHVSNNFLKHGYKSKQAIVFHTYVL